MKDPLTNCAEQLHAMGQRLYEAKQEIERLRLTDGERKAITFMLRHAAHAAAIPAFFDSDDYILWHDVLFALLERTK